MSTATAATAGRSPEGADGVCCSAGATAYANIRLCDRVTDRVTRVASARRDRGLCRHQTGKSARHAGMVCSLYKRRAR